MKTAQHPDNQQPITASDAAPEQAVCPSCGGVVILRRRKRMNGTCVYYWRHRDNRNRHCKGRSRPVGA